MLPVAGLRAATEGRFGEAETLFKVFLVGDPNSASAWSNLGNVHLSTGRAALALEDFDHAISLAPDVSLQTPAHSMASLKRHAAVSASVLQVAMAEKLQTTMVCSITLTSPVSLL